MVTLREILGLPVLRGARVVAGHRGLQAQVRWCHIAEVADIARLLSGRELLLTTGIALDLPPERQAAYVESLGERGVAGVMLELERQFSAAPPAMVEAANRVGLPLITLPFDTPFVQVTQEVATLILSREAQGAAEHAELADQGLLTDLASGLCPDLATLRHRLKALNRRLPEAPWLGFLVADTAAPLRAAATTVLGAYRWVAAPVGSEVHLLAFAADRQRLAADLRGVARHLSPLAAGAGRCVSTPGALPESLAEARQTMQLRRTAPSLSPLFEETGVYQLAAGRSSEELQHYVTTWLGALLQYDRAHHSNLCQTLRQVLDHGMSEGAERLHLTRQGLYHRLGRITELLGHPLEDAEVRLALSMALRFHDVLAAAQQEV